MISNSFNFVWVFKSYFNKHYWWCQQNWILWTWSKGYYVIISVHDFTSKTLSHDSSRIVDVVMWPKFGNSCISMREVIITLTWRNIFFQECSSFKFNNLGLALGMTFKFYTSMAKGLKQIVWMFLWLFFTLVEATEEKLAVGPFWPLSWIRLNNTGANLK